MAIAAWVYPASETITGSTSVALTDNKLTNALTDMTAWLNSTGSYSTSGVKYEVDTLVSDTNTTMTSNIAGWQTDVDNAIAGFSSTYYSIAQLDAGQLDNRYYTETELLNGSLDGRYYTETELANGALDGRYYTESEITTNHYTKTEANNLYLSVSGTAANSSLLEGSSKASVISSALSQTWGQGNKWASSATTGYVNYAVEALNLGASASSTSTRKVMLTVSVVLDNLPSSVTAANIVLNTVSGSSALSIGVAVGAAISSTKSILHGTFFVDESSIYNSGTQRSYLHIVSANSSHDWTSVTALTTTGTMRL